MQSNNYSPNDLQKLHYEDMRRQREEYHRMAMRGAGYQSALGLASSSTQRPKEDTKALIARRARTALILICPPT